MSKTCIDFCRGWLRKLQLNPHCIEGDDCACAQCSRKTPVLRALGFLFYDWPTSKSFRFFFFNVSSSSRTLLKKEIGASIRRMKNRRNTFFAFSLPQNTTIIASIPSWLIIMFPKSQLQRRLLASHWRPPFFSLNRIPMRAVTDWIFYYAIVFQLE